MLECAQTINFEPDVYPTVDVCILSHNRKEKLYTTLLHIDQLLEYPRDRYTIWVVDNNSADGSQSMVKELFPHVSLIELNSNIGITAWNKSFEKGCGEFVLVLDDDAYIEGSALRDAVQHLQKSERTAILSIRPINKETQLEFFDKYPTGRLSFWGCSALMRRCALEEVSYFDPDFFIQAFELDLSIRLRHKGWNIEIREDILSNHMTYAGGEYYIKVYTSVRNMLWIAIKYFDGEERWHALKNQLRNSLHSHARYSTLCYLKAALSGLVCGFLREKMTLSKDLQREYLNNFIEYAEPRVFDKAWQDMGYWKERPQFYPPLKKITPEKKVRQSLLIFMHALNMDGASISVLKALKNPEFRNRFSKIKIIADRNSNLGELQDELRILDVAIAIIPYKSMEDNLNSRVAIEFELRRLLRTYDRVWINTIDHPTYVLRIVNESTARGILFAHESLALDSAVIAESVLFDENKRSVLADMAYQQNIKLCWPSKSTVSYAVARLQTEDIYKLPYGINRSQYVEDRYIDLTTIHFLVTGWFCKRKNQSVMLPVLKEVQDAIKNSPEKFRKYTITFVGTPLDHPEYHSFRNICEKELDGFPLSFLGLIPNKDLRDLMSSQHFVVIPSKGEALCVTAMEMMASGGIVLHSDCEGHEELIEDAHSGFIFDRNSKESLVHLLLNVLSKECKIDFSLVSRNAYKKMHEFSEEQYSQNLSNLIRDEINCEHMRPLIGLTSVYQKVVTLEFNHISKGPQVIVVLVTHNKLELLKSSLNAIKAQTAKIDKVIIVNNASSDGTTEWLNSLEVTDEVEILHLKENMGGAGGFNLGIKRAYEHSPDWIWLLDDDAIPNAEALSHLINGVKKKPNASYFCSLVKWKDGSICQMNIPWTHHSWTEELDTEKNIIKISASSFVSCLINASYIDRAGFPIKEFFIWYDDLEYTMRLSKIRKGYLVPNSIVQHHTDVNEGVNWHNVHRHNSWKYLKGVKNEMSLICFGRELGFFHALVRLAEIQCALSSAKSSLILRGRVFYHAIRGFCSNYNKYIEKSEKNHTTYLRYKDALIRNRSYFGQDWTAVWGTECYIHTHPPEVTNHESTAGSFIFRNVLITKNDIFKCSITLVNHQSERVRFVVEAIDDKGDLYKYQIVIGPDQGIVHVQFPFSSIVSSQDTVDLKFYTVMDDGAATFAYSSALWLNPRIFHEQD